MEFYGQFNQTIHNKSFTDGLEKKAFKVFWIPPSKLVPLGFGRAFSKIGL
jgi:hypothetical protein